MSKDRNYNFNIICYDIESLERYVKMPHIKHYAYILHDKDISEDNKPKTPHYHCSITFINARSFNAVLKEAQKLLIGNVQVEITEDLRAILDYLIHARDPTKHQYSRSQVISTYNYDGKDFGSTAINIIDDIISERFTYYELAKKYGRDLILNYNKYKAFADLCINEECLIRKSTGEIFEPIKIDFKNN